MPSVKKSLALREQYGDGVLEYLRSGKVPEGDADTFLWSANRQAVRKAWKAVGKELTADYVGEYPGGRCWGWWTFEAPRWSKKFGAWFDGTLPLPRLRIGGTGTPSYEVSAVVPTFENGLPDYWEEDIDPENPPTFESTASYLRRQDLLLPGELKRLKDADFMPEVVR